VAWEADRLQTEEVGDNRLRPLAGLVDVPPIPAALRRLCEWTADYYLSPLAAVLRMVMPSSAALAGPRTMIEYRPTGETPARLTPQREQALSNIEGRQGTGAGPAPRARPRIRSPGTQRRAAGCRRQPEGRCRKWLRSRPARRGHRLGQDRGLL